MDIAHLLNPDHPPMDIARLLNHDDSEQSDHELPVSVGNSAVSPSPMKSVPPAATPERAVTLRAPLPGTGVMPAPTPQRAVARPRPQRQRKPSIQKLQAQREACEFVVKHLPYVLRDMDDASSSTSANSIANDEDDATDHDGQRMRSFLKNMLVLSEQAREEIAIRTEYLRLLKHHHQGRADLRKLMTGLRLDDWFWMCDRWRQLALDYYQPLSHGRCYAIARQTLRAIKTHKLPEGTKETDAFGWLDSLHLDADRRYVRFVIRKTLNAELNQVVDHSWSLYQDGELFKKAHHGDNCEVFLQVLQRISPDMMIVQRVEKFPDVQLTHSLVIIFRVQTKTGHMIVFRCIDSPQLQSLMKAEGLNLCGSFHWENFDVAHRNTQGECDAIRFTLAGSIGSENPMYARRWRDEILIALVRYETQYLNTAILPTESITAVDSSATTAIQVLP